MSIINKTVLVISMVLMAQTSLAGSLTITAKDKNGRTKTIVQQTYDTPAATKSDEAPTRHGPKKQSSPPVVITKQEDQDLAQKAAHEERLLRRRIVDYKRLEAQRLLNTSGGIRVYDYYGPKIRALEERLRALRKNPGLYFKYASKDGTVDLGFSHRFGNDAWPYYQASPAYSFVTRGAGPGYYRYHNSESDLALGIVLPPKRFFGSPRPYKWEDDPYMIRPDESRR